MAKQKVCARPVASSRPRLDSNSTEEGYMKRLAIAAATAVLIFTAAPSTAQEAPPTNARPSLLERAVNAVHVSSFDVYGPGQSHAIVESTVQGGRALRVDVATAGPARTSPPICAPSPTSPRPCPARAGPTSSRSVARSMPPTTPLTPSMPRPRRRASVPMPIRAISPPAPCARRTRRSRPNGPCGSSPMPGARPRSPSLKRKPTPSRH